ncbi:butyrophilin-like protein 2 [Oncorhynchus masou masou]|uniref:butyrophilin-like protein 2 n=1 Tax=Oncorhynchus masou masou TaxID=90313 RepID=UPI0031843294
MCGMLWIAVYDSVFQFLPISRNFAQLLNNEWYNLPQDTINSLMNSIKSNVICHMPECNRYESALKSEQIASEFTIETSHVSPDPVVAVADDDVILPCSLLNFTKSAGLILKWSISNLKDPTGKDKVVHFYRDGRDSNVDQDESYRGRTSLFKELKNGNVSLKLSQVKLSDEGNYMCYILVQEPNSLVHETVIQLIVVAVSNPVISINGTKGSGVVLKCEAKSWYPKPEMNWLDSERQVLLAGSAETHRDTEGLYIVRRHVTVNKNVTNTFTCRVQLQKLNFTRETEYNVPDEMFPTVSWVWIAVPVFIVCGLVVGFMWIKYQKLRKKIGKLWLV